MSNGRFSQKKKGFTLIEGIIALAIFILLISVFYKIFSQSVIHLSDSKYRRAAVALANERMEHYRNIPYDDVGTLENAPFGDIVDDENVEVNGMVFRIISSVFFVDDPADGTAPTDLLFEDYKRVKVVIVWGDGIRSSVSKSDAEFGDLYKKKRVHLVSQFVPPGGMETVATGGILSVNVLDSEASPIADALITIYDLNNDTTISTFTDETGNYMYVGAPECESCYEITVEKSGYETISTEESYNGTTQVYDPRFVHQSVISGELTTSVININRVSTVEIISKDPLGNNIPDVDFDVFGGRILGTDPNNDGANVYNYSSSLASDENGSVFIKTDTDNDGDIDDNANPGSYFFTLNEPNYLMWKIVVGDENDPLRLNVLSGSDGAYDMILIDERYDSAFIHVVDSDGVPISLASVQMTHAGLGYDVELITDDYGYVFFPENDSDILESGEVYDIRVTALDFEEEIDSVEIDELVQKEIVLTES